MSPSGSAAAAAERRIVEHVARLAAEHPPIAPDSVDHTVRNAVELQARFGHVLDYLARVELEVDRNVLELIAMLPSPPDIDRVFYAEVWQPQEIRHGQLLDALRTQLGRGPVVPRLGPVSPKIRVLGALSHVGAFQDVCRMLYYLTGTATERSAVLAYNLLYDGLVELREHAVATTVVGQIRRQEPGHYAFYQLSARALWAELDGWQKWLVRLLRRASFAPVGAGDDTQKADFGDVMSALDIPDRFDDFAEQISRVERELLCAADRGLKAPAYVTAAFREAVELATARRDREQQPE